MAVPKKRTSKSKKNMRKANWKDKARIQTIKAFSLPSSKLNKRALKKKNKKIAQIETTV